MTPCHTDGCTSATYAKGLCKTHYFVWYRLNPKNKRREQERDTKPDRKTRQSEARDARLYNLLPGDYKCIRDFQEGNAQFRLLLNRAGTRKREAVEHRHSDGLIRGVMSGMLNRAYGLIERLHPHNTADILRALAAFHDNPPATDALLEPVYGLMGRARHKKKMLYGPTGSPTPQYRQKARKGLYED